MTDRPDEDCRLSVVLPTRNERETIEFLLYSFGSVLYRRYQRAYELIVVDDSTDGSFEYLQGRVADTPGSECVRLVHRTEGGGLATAIAAGLKMSRGQTLAVMDADFNHNPNDVPRLLDRLEDCDLVVGSRFIPGGGMINAGLRYHGSRLFNIAARRALDVETHDNLSGFWVMRRQPFRDLVEGSDIFRGYGDYFLRMLYKARRTGLKIAEVPVVYFGRLSGESKTRFGRDLLRYSRTILDLRRHGV